MTLVKSQRSPGASHVTKKKQAVKARKKLKTGVSVGVQKGKKAPESKANRENKSSKKLAKSQATSSKMPATAEKPDSPSKKTKRVTRSKTGETQVKPGKPGKKNGGKQIFNKNGKSGAAAANQSLKRQRDLAAKLKRGVVYLSHLPHGFYEDEIKKYCSQFGRVTGVYVPRSKAKNSKGYGFVEFQHPEVAAVVADTMNNYLMFDRLIKAKVVPMEEQKPYIFERNRKTNVLKAKVKKIKQAVKEKERILTPEEEAKRKRKAIGQVEKIHKELKAKGLDYEFEVAY